MCQGDRNHDMSIIHEALKKVQEHREHDNGAGHPATPHPSAGQALPGHLGRMAAAKAAEKDSPAVSRPSLARRIASRPILAAGVLLTGLIVLGMAIKFSEKLFVVTPIAKPLPPIEELADGLTLNGVLSMETKKVALINNEIYEVGDVIAGMTVTDITANSVQLIKDGRTLTLQTKKF